MHTPLETIIEELFTFDPALREHESEIRTLVISLLETKPSITVSQSFLENLRRELLVRARVETPKTKPILSSISWWALRLVPVGAIAILMLTLLPSRGISPTTTYPLQERSGGTETSSDTLYKTNNAPSLMMEESTRAPLILTSVTVGRPSFVVIHVSVDGELGEIVGVSKFLTPGTTVGVQINFLRGVSQNESLSGVVYADNGDGFFDERDTLLPGTPLTLPLN